MGPPGLGGHEVSDAQICSCSLVSQHATEFRDDSLRCRALCRFAWLVLRGHDGGSMKCEKRSRHGEQSISVFAVT